VRAAVAPELTAPAPPNAPGERGWGRTLVGLAAALAVSAAALWPAALAPAAAVVRGLVPVQETMLLVVPAVAACALVGWWAGGRLALAVVWLALAAFVLAQPVPARVPGYAALARGWALVLAAAFGGACVLGGARRAFVGRALAAVGLAFAVAGGSLVLGGRGPSDAAAVVRAELGRRVDGSLGVWRRHAARPAWRRAAGAEAVRAADAVETLAALPVPAAVVAPALLGLESLAALALAWSLYHRVGRARVGLPLGPLAGFRFNDQLVWGAAVGATLVVVPSARGPPAVGINLLVFFGALYALRGLGVLTWWPPGARPARRPRRRAGSRAARAARGRHAAARRPARRRARARPRRHGRRVARAAPRGTDVLSRPDIRSYSGAPRRPFGGFPWK
jgi:hypothetical protein